ncbi:MAG: flagellin lysine-N-methylase [Eubacterium sp.]|nr:flagellin lysine-N-methylase [Eubacterium sp.]
MIFRYPDYYDEFQCIADRCKDTCCAGWEIDIDDASYEAYQKVPGEFGKRLMASIKEYELEDGEMYEKHGFILKENKRCPFLDEIGLCDLYKELGEDALCEVCTDTPRNYLEFGGQRELSLSVSCPEAARLVLAKNAKTTFVEKELNEEFPFEEDDEEQRFAKDIRMAREQAIRILQNREVPTEICLQEFLDFSEEIQQQWNQGEMFPKEQQRYDQYELFLKRMVLFTSLESISEEWETILQELQTTFVENKDGKDCYEAARQKLKEIWSEPERCFEMEQLAVYDAFLCLARCVDDYDFLGKAKFVVVSLLMMEDMAAGLLAVKNRFTKEDAEDVARIYAKEVEHSQENMDAIYEEFLFEDGYDVENLKRALLFTQP